METFALGLISGILLMAIRDIPALAWSKPHAFGWIAEKLYWISVLGLGIANIGAYLSQRDQWREIGLITAYTGVALGISPLLANVIIWITQEMRRQEARHGNRKSAGDESVSKAYQPRRPRKRL